MWKGEKNTTMGVPRLFSEQGLDHMIELPLNERERGQFKQSAASIRVDIEKLK